MLSILEVHELKIREPSLFLFIRVTVFDINDGTVIGCYETDIIKG
jgi:hypothetical protein